LQGSEGANICYRVDCGGIRVSASVDATEAVSRALRNYAGIEVSKAQAAAAAQGIRVARTAYLASPTNCRDAATDEIRDGAALR
jgi:hypothetical protein